MSLVAYLNYFLWNDERVLGLLKEATAAVIDRCGVFSLNMRGSSSPSSVSVGRNHGTLLMGVNGGADLVLMLRICLLKVAERAEGVRFVGDASLSQLRCPSYTSSSHREGVVQVGWLILSVAVEVYSCASLVFGDHLICANVCIWVKGRGSQSRSLPLTPDIGYLYLTRLHLRSYSSLMGKSCGLSELWKNNLRSIWLTINFTCWRFCSIASTFSRRPWFSTTTRNIWSIICNTFITSAATALQAYPSNGIERHVLVNFFKRLIVYDWIVLDPARRTNRLLGLGVHRYTTLALDLLRLVLTYQFDIAVGIFNHGELVILHLLKYSAKFLLSLLEVPQVLNRPIVILLVPILPRVWRGLIFATALLLRAQDVGVRWILLVTLSVKLIIYPGYHRGDRRIRGAALVFSSAYVVILWLIESGG